MDYKQRENNKRQSTSTSVARHCQSDFIDGLILPPLAKIGNWMKKITKTRGVTLYSAYLESPVTQIVTNSTFAEHIKKLKSICEQRV